MRKTHHGAAPRSFTVVAALAAGAVIMSGAVFAGGPAIQEIKTVGGVEIVQNGKTPRPQKGSPTTLTLTAELEIGGGDDPDRSFAEVVGMAVDAAGTVYALDMKDKRVKVYDAAGAFVRAIGKPGQGPGEFDMPSGIQLTPAGELMVEDATNRRLSFFATDGQFLRQVSTADRMGLVNVVMLPDGRYVAREMTIDQAKMTMAFEVKIFDAGLEPLAAIDKIEFAIPIGGRKMNVMDMMASYKADPSGRLAYGRNLDYEIVTYDGAGKPLRKVRREFEPVKVTEKDMEEMLARIPDVASAGANVKEMIEFPDVFPPYWSFLYDNAGRLIVRTWEKGPGEDEYMHDVFDQQGRFAARFACAAELQVWNGDLVYGTFENPDGLRVIKRYRAVWK